MMWGFDYKGALWRRRSALAVGTVVVLLSAGGCGQKGPLYLPEAEPETPQEEFPEIEQEVPPDLSG